MARISGVDLPREKRIEIGLTYIYGIGRTTAKNILAETLQYLGVEPEYTQEELEYIDIALPSLADMTRSEAEVALKDLGLSIRFIGNGETVTDQIPKAYAKVAKGTKVVAYTGDETAKKTATVANVTGKSASEANRAIIDAGLNVRINGASLGQNGYAICAGQSPSAGAEVEPGTIVTLDFTYTEIAD